MTPQGAEAVPARQHRPGPREARGDRSAGGRPAAEGARLQLRGAEQPQPGPHVRPHGGATEAREADIQWD